MRRSLWLALPMVGLMAGGCTPGVNSSDPLRSFAASLVAGRAFDRAQGALNHNDSEKLADAGADLRRASVYLGDERLTAAFAAGVAADANNSLAMAQSSSGSEKTHLFQVADRKYRAALAFVPEKAPEKALDASTLNSLGYFLADRGRNQDDFAMAATLTMASFKKWDVSTSLLGIDPRVGRAAGPQDSYAWALFKLGRYNEARLQEEEVLKLLRAQASSGLTSEIPFHMAEIYNALGEIELAQHEYEEALKLGPDAELKGKIEMRLKALDFKRV